MSVHGILAAAAAAEQGFSPLLVVGIRAWFRSDQGIVLTAGAVSSWGDLSGHGRHVTQAVAIDRPTVTAGALNGIQGVTYPGGAGNVTLSNTAGNLFSAAGNARSIFAVAISGTDVGGTIVSARLTGPFQATSANKTGANCFVCTDGVNAPQNVTIADFSKTTGFYGVWLLTGAGADPTVRIDGTVRGITSGGTSQGTESGTTGFEIGHNGNGSIWAGSILEVAAWDRTLTTAEAQQLEAYAQARYALP